MFRCQPLSVSQGLARLRRWLLAVAMPLVMVLPLALWPPLPAQAAQAAQAAQPRPETVRIGAFLTGLGDLDPAKKSFSASFWLWTVGPSDQGSALDRLEFPNAIKVESPNAVTEVTPFGIWAQRKIVGSFRHGWDLRRFPFDSQLLRIQLEEAERPSTSFLYSADQANSSFDPEMNLSGWRIRSTRLVTSTKTYRTSFGDPRLKPGSPSSYAHAELQIELERIDRSGFWKLSVGAFAAALIALASYGLRVDSPSALSPRFALLAGSAFAAVISLRTSAAELGASGYTTLIDQVHAAVLFYILVATAAGVVAWRRFQRHGEAEAIQRFERRMAGTTTLGFFVLILVLVLAAMLSGGG